MPNYDLLEKRNPEKLQQLKEIWEPRKEYIEKDLWVIRNFLSQEEIDWLMSLANDPTGWYPTMRSKYANNTQNKFIGYIPQYGEDGILIPPHPKNNPQFVSYFQLGEIQDRMESVLPKYFSGAGAFQSLMEVSDEDILEAQRNNKFISTDDAMDWHYERDDSDDWEKQHAIAEGITSEGKITASFNIYLNNNFEGGILEFRHKPYSIKPEPGMLVNIPLYKEFEHKVTKISGGNRHTLYGRCWDDLEINHMSSREDC